MNKASSFLVCLASALICCGTSASAETLRTVAFSENPVFGTSDQVFMRSPVLNNLGQTAFSARRSPNGGTSLWLEKDGLLNAVARVGDPASNGSEIVAGLGLLLAINNSSQTAFVASNGLWLEDGGSLAFLDRDHQSFYSSYGSFIQSAPSLNDAGQIAFQSGEGIWLAEHGALDSIALSGEVAPGTTSAFRGFLRIRRSNLASIDNRPVLNNLGQTAFHGLLELSDPDSVDGSAVWKGGVNSLELVARAGDPAPGTEANFSTHDRFFETRAPAFSPSGPAFSHVSFFNPAINDAGQTAFRAYLDDGPGVDRSNNEGLWSERNGSLALVARTGDSAPETDHVFVGFDNIPVLNGQGQTAFRAVIKDPEDENQFEAGIWSERDGVLKLVARTGDPVFGGGNVSFSPGEDFPLQDFAIRVHRSFGSPVINKAGQVAFQGRYGIWAQDSQGLLKLIVKESDQIDVDDGPGTDLRTVEELYFTGGSGNEDGRPSGFNDRGQLAFSARFTDGSSGVFVSNLVAVPEPSSLVLLLLAAGLLIDIQRRN